MPYIISGGKPIRVSLTLPAGVIEVPEEDVFLCPECDKEYKTEAGLARHIEDKH